MSRMSTDSPYDDSTGPIATVGLLRGRNAQPLVAARNNANSGDVEVVRVNASDMIVITNVATPTSAGDAASKGYVDSLVTSATPSSVGTTNSVGTSSTLAHSDHVHAHGNQTSGSLHAVATTSVAGFMSAADFDKLGTIITGSSPYSISEIQAGWFEHEVSDGSSGSSKTVDFSTGQNHKLTLTASCAIAFVFPGVGSYQLKIIQDSPGGWVPSFSISGGGGAVYRAGGNLFLSTAANATDILTAYFDGTDAYLVAATAFS